MVLVAGDGDNPMIRKCKSRHLSFLAGNGGFLMLPMYYVLQKMVLVANGNLPNTVDHETHLLTLNGCNGGCPVIRKCEQRQLLFQANVGGFLMMPRHVPHKLVIMTDGCLPRHRSQSLVLDVFCVHAAPIIL